MSLDRLQDGADAGGFGCSYGSYNFGPTADTTGFSVRPVLDPAGRTVTHAVYTITVTETIADATTTDPEVLAAIATLSRNGDKLVFIGRGFGDVVVNVAGGSADVKFGPVTKNISCVPAGAGRAVILTWTVEFAIVNCPDALKGILYFNYGFNFAIDSHGYTTRTYNSELVLAATRKSVTDRKLPSSADDHREKTVPPLPIGFRRESQNYKLSLDKQKLETTVVDVQMPYQPPPEGCIQASFEQSWQTQGSFAKWVTTFTGTYDIDRATGSAADAVKAYMFALDKRRKVIEGGIKIGDGLPGGVDAAAIAGGRGRLVGQPVRLIPMSATASDPNVYGRQQVRISSTYLCAGFGLSAVLQNGGLWTPLSNGGAGVWKNWATRLPHTMGPRGHAVLSFSAADENIVDLCGNSIVTPPPVRRTPNPQAAPLEGGQQQGGGSQGGNNQSQNPYAGAGLFGALAAAGGAVIGGVGDIVPALKAAFPPPPAGSSWLGVVMHLTTRAMSGRVLGSTLPTTPISVGGQSSGQTWDAMGDLPAGGQVASPFPPLRTQLGGSQSSTTGTFVQQRTKPVLYLTLSGSAVRIGHSIPVPELTQVNGKVPVLVGEPYFSQGVVYESISGPIVRAEWSLTYAFVDDGGTGSGVPDKTPLPVPPNGTFA